MDIWQEIAASAPARFVAETAWAYPMLETVHILGLGLVYGSIIAFDLRVFGVSRALPLALMARHLLPWVWTGFAINAVSGVLLFMSDATEFAANPALKVKLTLIALAGLNALLFHRAAWRAIDAAGTDATAPPRARLHAALSMTLWTSAIVAGRMIAYTGG